MTIRRTNMKSQMSSPRKTNRGGTKNMKRAAVSHHPLELFANSFLQRCSKLLSSFWRGLRQRLHSRRKSHRLHVCDVTALGERRFVAVVQYGRRRFLVGGGVGSVSLISKLDREDLQAVPPQTEREGRNNVPPLPLIPATDEASPFNVKIAEASAGARLAI